MEASQASRSAAARSSVRLANIEHSHDSGCPACYSIEVLAKFVTPDGGAKLEPTWYSTYISCFDHAGQPVKQGMV